MNNSIISQTLNLAVQALLVELLFSNELSHAKARYAAFLFWSIFVSARLFFLPSENALVFWDMAATFGMVCLLLKSSWHERLLSALLAHSMASLICQLATIGANLAFGHPIFAGLHAPHGQIIPKAIATAILLMALLIKKRAHFCPCLSFATKAFLVLFSFIMMSLITFISSYQKSMGGSALNNFLLIGSAIVCTLILYLFSALQNSCQARQNHIQAQYIHTLKAYYEKLEANEREIRKIRHDMRSHIRVLNSLIQSGKYKEAQEYIHQIDDFTTQKIKLEPNAGNPFINATLLQKSIEFPSVSIEFKGFANENLSISDYDICTIVNNLLDNALEYSTIHHFGKIEFYIYQEKSILLITVANQLAETINVSQLGRHSTKAGKGHGYGIENVKEAVSRNHGVFQYEQKGNKLYAKVRLYLSN